MTRFRAGISSTLRTWLMVGAIVLLVAVSTPAAWAQDTNLVTSSPQPKPSVGVVDPDAPLVDTFIISTPPLISTNAVATFTFGGFDDSGPTSSFVCTLDGIPIACSDPFTTPPLASGEHTFTVSAIGSNGFGDTSPAVYTWTVDLVDIDPSQTVTETLPPTDSYTMTIVVPPGAVDLPGSVALSFGDIAKADLPTPPSGTVLLGFQLNLIEDVTIRSPYTFTQPITLTIAYDPALVTDPAQLRLLFKQADDTYSDDGITIVEPRTNPLQVTITHLTEFALVEQPPSSTLFLPSLQKPAAVDQ